METEAAQAPAAGLIIYTDQPSTYVEACEFASLDSGPMYSSISKADGKQMQVKTGRLWITVDYPPAAPQGGSSQGNLKDVANLNLAKIQKLLPQYPQFKAQLTAAQTPVAEGAGVSRASAEGGGCAKSRAAGRAGLLCDEGWHALR